MRNLLLALTVGLLTGEAMAYYRAYRMKKLEHDGLIDQMLDESFPDTDVPSVTSKTIRRVL